MEASHAVRTTLGIQSIHMAAAPPRGSWGSQRQAAPARQGWVDPSLVRVQRQTEEKAARGVLPRVRNLAPAAAVGHRPAKQAGAGEGDRCHSRRGRDSVAKTGRGQRRGLSSASGKTFEHDLRLCLEFTKGSRRADPSPFEE